MTAIKRPTQTTAHGAEDLVVMRKAISRLAGRLGIDLTKADDTRCCLDGDFSRFPAKAEALDQCQELREMLVLLFRLEDSNSEDLGIDGIRQLWQIQRKLMNRFHMREPLRLRPTNLFQAT